MPLIPAQEAEISVSEFKASLLHCEFQDSYKVCLKKTNKNKKQGWEAVVHAFDHSTQKEEAGRCL